MKIAIKDIPDSGALNLEQTFDLDELDLSDQEIQPCDPVNISLEAKKGLNIVIINIQASGAMYFNCSRCLKTYKWPFKKKITLNYQPKPNEFFIEIDQDLRQEIILDFPFKPLCSPDCQGLCPNCGQDLNEGKCTCGS